MIQVRTNIGKLALNHRNLWFAIVAGTGVFFLLPASASTITRALIAWNVTVLLLVAATSLLMSRLNARQIRARYQEEDPTAPVILLVVIAAALVSIVAIVAFLSTLKQVPAAEKAAHLTLATLTIVDSWLLVPTMFTLHYADLFYSADPRRPPLSFPETREPVFWDFAYFSFTIAAACQTADVYTTQAGIRKTVIAHSIISFVFNVSILGFAINVLAGLLSGS